VCVSVKLKYDGNTSVSGSRNDCWTVLRDFPQECATMPMFYTMTMFWVSYNFTDFLWRVFMCVRWSFFFSWLKVNQVSGSYSYTLSVCVFSKHWLLTERWAKISSLRPSQTVFRSISVCVASLKWPNCVYSEEDSSPLAPFSLS